MKRLIFTLLILAFAITVHAGEKGYIRKDPLRPGAYKIYNRKGNQTGTIRKDTLSKDRLNILDSTGNQEG